MLLDMPLDFIFRHEGSGQEMESSQPTQLKQKPRHMSGVVCVESDFFRRNLCGDGVL